MWRICLNVRALLPAGLVRFYCIAGMHCSAGRIHCPEWECTADGIHERDFRAEECISWQKAEYAVSTLEGSGRESAANSVRLANCSQPAFRKFHLNADLAVRGPVGFIGCINDALWWNFRKSSSMVRCGNGPVRFTNARSGFVPVFRPREWKLSRCLGSCKIYCGTRAVVPNLWYVCR